MDEDELVPTPLSPRPPRDRVVSPGAGATDDWTWTMNGLPRRRLDHSGAPAHEMRTPFESANVGKGLRGSAPWDISKDARPTTSWR